MVLLRLAKSYPFSRHGVPLFKTSDCDLMVQKVVEKRENIDWKRNIAFGTFGLFYLGGVQYMIYVPLFSRLFPSAAAFSAKTISRSSPTRRASATCSCRSSSTRWSTTRSCTSPSST